MAEDKEDVILRIKEELNNIIRHRKGEIRIYVSTRKDKLHIQIVSGNRFDYEINPVINTDL